MPGHWRWCHRQRVWWWEAHRWPTTPYIQHPSDPFLPGRFPSSVRAVLGEVSLQRANNSSGCEIRFMSDCDEVYVTLMSRERNSFVYTYCGDYLCERIELCADVVTKICIKRPQSYSKTDLELIKTVF